MGLEELLEAGLDAQQAETVLGMWRCEKETLGRAFEEKEFEHALRCELKGLRFSSLSAEKAFMFALREQGLRVADGGLEGYGEFLEDYRRADPDAFMCPAADKALVISSAAAGARLGGEARLEQLRAAFGLRAE